jgi:hypothetical protein
MDEKRGGHHDPASAAELLGDWRAAERDTVAAHAAASVAAQAAVAAAAAQEAADQTEVAAQAAMEAANRAREAANRAKQAAAHAAEAAQTGASAAAGDERQADRTVIDAEKAEADARTRYRTAQEGGFPKSG